MTKEKTELDMKKEYDKRKTKAIKEMKKRYKETMESEIGISVERTFELRDIVKEIYERNEMLSECLLEISELNLTKMERIYVAFVLGDVQCAMNNPISKLIEAMG